MNGGQAARRRNSPERLRQLLLELYVSGCIDPRHASDAERGRLKGVVLAAAMGLDFDDLGLPFPKPERRADEV